MIEDYEKNTGEDDLSHVEEAYAAHSLNEGARPKELRKLLETNFSHRMMHHHVLQLTN